MEYTVIDMSKYPRRKHFDYFQTLAYPYVGMTVNMDVTEFVDRTKAEGLPFFLSLCYCVAQAANGVAEFRQRIKKGGIMPVYILFLSACRPCRKKRMSVESA